MRNYEKNTTNDLITLIGNGELGAVKELKIRVGKLEKSQSQLTSAIYQAREAMEDGYEDGGITIYDDNTMYDLVDNLDMYGND